MKKVKEKSFLSHAATYGFGTILLQAGGLILLPIYVNYLNPAEFGVLDILDRIGMILLIGLMANGFRMATLTFFRQAETEAERERVAITVSTALFGTVLIGLVLAALSAKTLSGWLGIDNHWLLLFGIATGLAEAIMIIPMALMQARLQSTKFVQINVCMFLMRLVSLLLMVVAFQWGLWGILAARMINAILFGAYLYRGELSRATGLPDWNTFRDVFWFALPFLPGGLLAFFLGFGDRFFLIRHAGDYELGLYAMGCRLVGFIPALTVGPMYKVWSAKMYDEAKKKDANIIFGKAFSRIIVAYVFVAFGLALFATDLLMALGGSEYLPGLLALPPLILCGFLGKSADLMDAAFYIQRKTKYKPWILAAVAGTALLTYWTLIPPYGFVGAAWATAIATAVHAGLTFAISQRIFPVKYEWKRISLLLVAALVLHQISTLYSDHPYRMFLDALLVFVLMAVIWMLATPMEQTFIGNLVRNRLSRFAKLQKRLGWER